MAVALVAVVVSDVVTMPVALEAEALGVAVDFAVAEDRSGKTNARPVLFTTSALITLHLPRRPRGYHGYSPY